MIGKQKRIKECQQIATTIKPTKTAISSVPNTCLITPIILHRYDARVSVKPGKARQLNYFGQIAVDDAHHVITGACSDFADKRDSQCLEQIVELTEENLKENGIELEELLADGGYSSGESIGVFTQKNINAYIPNFGQYKPEREGFTFNKEENYYQCTKTRRQPSQTAFQRRKTDSKGYTKRTYRSSKQIAKTVH